jgi:hypothetical protein
LCSQLIRHSQSFESSPPTLIFPASPNSDSSPSTPPGSVPSSPSLPRSPRSPVPDSGQEEREEKTKGKYPLVPPLLRPRQIHPTKANKLGITKPVKKRRNTEHLYCRHCGTTETPEWRRGPDGRKSYPSILSPPYLFPCNQATKSSLPKLEMKSPNFIFYLFFDPALPCAMLVGSTSLR